jgi:hypothetical protein
VTDEEFAEWEQVAESVVAEALAPFGLAEEDYDLLAALFVSDLLFEERFVDTMKQLVLDARSGSGSALGSALVDRLPAVAEEAGARVAKLKRAENE